jgi:serine/threonine protein kinase
MAILVKVPELTQATASGIITWWDKQVGDEVLFGDLLVEIRSGHEKTEVKAYTTGTLLHIFSKPGNEVSPEDNLAIIGEKNEDVASFLTSLTGPSVQAPVYVTPTATPVQKPIAETPSIPFLQESSHTNQSGFNQTFPKETSEGSGFTFAPTITPTEKADPIPAEGSFFSIHPEPTGYVGDERTKEAVEEGSSFATAPALEPVDSGREHFQPGNDLTNEQAQNQALYGKGFERFIKMRLIPQQGAMGEIFYATQAISGRDVVVKRLRKEKMNDAKAREYFAREINLGSLIPYHRNIVNILYSDSNENGPYYVMERVNGHSLAYIIENQALSDEKVSSLFKGILEGVRHIHNNFMVHRDLKPQNILVDTQHNLPRIIDFGFAKHGAYPDTQVFNMGTPGYMAPEQKGDQKSVDERADIYALGCILYNMLTHEHPSDIHLDKIANPQFKSIIARCTQADPIRRYRTIQEIIDELGKTLIIKEEKAVSSSQQLESFKAFINELVLEILPSGQPLSKMTTKLLQKQAGNAGLTIENLEAELEDFKDLYMEISTSGNLTPFKRRSLLMQGEVLFIKEQTIDQLLRGVSKEAPRPSYIAPPTSVPREEPRVVTPQPEPEVQVLEKENRFTATTRYPKKKYARAVGLFDGFDEDKLSDTSHAEALFEITLTDEDHATFAITDNALAQENALLNKRYFLQPACSLAQVEPTLDQRIHTMEPGALRKQGSVWKITRKATIRIG